MTDLLLIHSGHVIEIYADRPWLVVKLQPYSCIYVIMTACANFESTLYYFKHFDGFLEFMILYNICFVFSG